MTLRQIDDHDWWVLEDCGTDTIVEGSMDEWLEISAAMRERKSCSHRRCAAYWRGHYYSLLSPRNSEYGSEEACLFGDEIDAFADAVVGLAMIGHGAGI